MSFTIFPLWLTLLLATAAAAIPILIHLLHRQRTQPVYWGAMQFLRQTPLQQRRRKKVDHWLLMLLRVALVVLLVFFVAWPKPNRASAVLGGGGGTDIGIVIDHSLSTGRRGGGATVFGKCVEAVGQLANSGSLKATDAVAVVLAEHTPRKLTALPVAPGALPRVVADLKQMPPGRSDGSIPDAVQAARDVLARGRNGRKVVIVLSDEQRTGWKPQDAAAWNAAVGPRGAAGTGVKVYDVPVPPDGKAANVSVTNVAFAPDFVGTSRPTVITATVANTGAAEVAAQTARLIVTGKPVSQQPVPALRPGQSKTIRFEHTFTEPGSQWVRVRVDAADALEADNAAVAAAYVWQQLPVLVVDGQLMNIGSDAADATAAGTALNAFRGSRFLVAAMLSDAANPDAPPLVRPDVVGVADRRLGEARGGINLEDYPAVVLNDVPQLPAAFQNRLADYARTGHGVWVILGKNTESKFITDALGQAGLVSLELTEQRGATEVAPALDVRDPANPMLATLVAGEHTPFGGVGTFKWWSVRPRDADARVVLATAGSGAASGPAYADPLVLDRPVGSSGGRVVVWTTSADKTWNNWPAAPVFAPLVNLTLHHLASGQTRGMESRQLASGQPVLWTGPAAPAVNAVTITRPDGTQVERRPVVRDGRQVLSYGETDLPGLYQLRFDVPAIPQPVYYGVGIDRGELDGAALTDEDLKWLGGADRRYVRGRIDASRGLAAALTGSAEDAGRIWRWLAGFVIATLVAETFLTYRMIRRQSRTGAEVLGGARSAARPVRLG